MLVHPHACGENPEYTGLPVVTKGPPPRVWGKLWAMQIGVEFDRSTPTRVGKTEISHPHIAGSVGPPPRVWGKPVDSAALATPLIRSTPTRVGTSFRGRIGAPCRKWVAVTTMPGAR